MKNSFNLKIKFKILNLKKKIKNLSHHFQSSPFQERSEIKAIWIIIKHMRVIESISNALSQHLTVVNPHHWNVP